MSSSKTPSNFQPEIHVVDYADQYRQKAVTADSFLNDSARQRESLDGLWNFSIDQYDTFLRARWFLGGRVDESGKPRPPDSDFDHWEEVSVPSCWNMTASEYRNYEGGAVYTRTFRYHPADSAGKERVFLKVGAANYESFLFLNGKCIGFHRGGSTPFFLELTEELGADNRLSIFINNRREKEQVPTDNTDWFNYGGLYRSVELIRVPGVFIRRFSAALVPGSNYSRIRVAVDVDGQGPTEARVKIPALGIEISIPVSAGSGSVEFDAKPMLWSPESPTLYEVEFSLSGGDSVTDRIGFREVSATETGVLINGKPVYLKGVSCHEDSLANGKAVTREEIHTMFDVAEELGCNFVRLAHYPHSGEAARIADERGFLLWEEIPVYWAIAFANRKTHADAENQLSELILRDRNRASVILWSVGNENPDSDERLEFMSSLAAHARKLDGTRLVTAACLWNRELNRIEDRLADHLDVIGINEYFGWYEGNFDDLAAFFAHSKPGKPVIVSEFGAGARTGNHGTAEDLFTEENQRQVYEHQIKAIGSAPYVAGLTPWILFDFRSPRRLNRLQNGFNLKGLVDADTKRKKLAFYTLRSYYASSGRMG